MKYIIGKRYMWSLYNSLSVPKGKNHMYVDGILIGANSSGNAFLTSRQGEGWIVPLENLMEVKKPYWRK